MNVEAIVGGVAAAFASSAYLTTRMRRFALNHSLVDIPNDRSSHSAVTPRGGGIAIVFTASAALLVLFALRVIPARMFVGMAGGGAVVAIIGYLDDRHHLAPSLRLAAHAAAAVWALVLIGVNPSAMFGSQNVRLIWFGYLATGIGIVWILNLFNFMDGIDGIAASEAAFVALCGSALAWAGGGNHALSLIGILFAASVLGFLVWNWPPAKIFMGDVGSGYVGYFIALLVIVHMRTCPVAFWRWLILAGIFVADASVTVVRRAVRGDRVFQAHRSHAYQWLARRWQGHWKVTTAVGVINILWLLPAAVLASLHAAQAPWIAAGALAPVVVAVCAAGAGRPEHAGGS